jgi:hypothetical protein
MKHAKEDQDRNDKLRETLRRRKKDERKRRRSFEKTEIDGETWLLGDPHEN